MASHLKLGRKPWALTEETSFSGYTSWKINITHCLKAEPNFVPFLQEGSKWLKKSSKDVNRGLKDDPEGTQGGLKATEKFAHLEQMLGLLTQWVPCYLAKDIVDNSTSIHSVWHFIRKYFGFQQSETQFMRFTAIKWEEGERPERLYQRVLAHLQDNLLVAGSPLKHDGETLTHDEDMSLTTERLAVLKWLELIHPSLIALVSRTFAFDLQRMTLKDLQPQIVDALDGFLEELRQDDARASRVFAPSASSSRPRRVAFDNSNRRRPASRERYPRSSSNKTCRVCKEAGRTYIGHDFFACDYVSRAEKRSMRANAVDVGDGSDVDDLSTGVQDVSLDQESQ